MEAALMQKMPRKELIRLKLRDCILWPVESADRSVVCYSTVVRRTPEVRIMTRLLSARLL